jgi:riboflavin synthase
VVPETLRRTNLGRLQQGDRVNLERSLELGGSLDGHLVQGHVDATAAVEEVTDAQQGRELAIQLPEELKRYVAEKGSIAVDGTSLTVSAVDDASNRFSVALIPHTLEHTIAGGYRPGSLVNLEVDLLARYLERLVRPSTEPGIK